MTDLYKRYQLITNIKYKCFLPDTNEEGVAWYTFEATQCLEFCKETNKQIVSIRSLRENYKIVIKRGKQLTKTDVSQNWSSRFTTQLSFSLEIYRLQCE